MKEMFGFGMMFTAWHDYSLDVTQRKCYSVLAMKANVTVSSVYEYPAQPQQVVFLPVYRRYPAGRSLPVSEVEHPQTVGPFSSCEV
jgi:hypothetical protein